jgi:hypothetical protein
MLASIADVCVVVLAGSPVSQALVGPSLESPASQALTLKPSNELVVVKERFWPPTVAVLVVVEVVTDVVEENVVEVVVPVVVCVVVGITGGMDMLQGQKRRAVSIALVLQRAASGTIGSACQPQAPPSVLGSEEPPPVLISAQWNRKTSRCS